MTITEKVDKFGRKIHKQTDRLQLVESTNKYDRFIVIIKQLGAWGEETDFKQFSTLAEAERYFHLRVAPKESRKEDVETLIAEMKAEIEESVNGFSRTKVIGDVKFTCYGGGFNISFPDKRTHDQRGNEYVDTLEEVQAIVLKKLNRK